MKKSNINSRFPFIDALRGFTIVLMIFFHSSFDLANFGFIRIDILRDPFWFLLPRIIVFLFLFAVGMSLTLAHKEKIQWRAFWMRFAKLAFFALIISAVTYKIFPENWIYFGTLHAIALISLLSLPFLTRPKLSLILALALFIPSLFFQKNIPWFTLPHQSWDYIEPFPWLGASLLGIFAVHKRWHDWKTPENTLFKSLNYLGKHSLFIYLVHQPILFGLTYFIHSYLNR